VVHHCHHQTKRIFPRGYIIQLIGDNMTAISCLQYAACFHHLIVHELSHFAMALTLSCCYSLKLSSKHLSGKSENQVVDALSRLRDFPTWACTTQWHSLLSTCQAYWVPYEILYVIALIISSAKTGVVYEPEMTRLLTLELFTLSVGSNETSSHWFPSGWIWTKQAHEWQTFCNCPQ
jgi:hypothetical protein